ncbi:hypothetical protein TNCT_708071 [Trichonephila clavata]|uniref:Uncharacterized protein n=1 Tax=Trichonephila clavata TaxID=2740835 RepID=A0A8X6L084_TRICU|nr:hypothetical protein TNCT_708071 [Trichonephila clavata]
MLTPPHSVHPPRSFLGEAREQVDVYNFVVSTACQPLDREKTARRYFLRRYHLLTRVTYREALIAVPPTSTSTLSFSCRRF